MKNTIKKIGILFAVLIIGLMLAMSVSAKEVVESGECGAEGDNVIWTLYDDGELIISGEGEMKNGDYRESPFDKIDIKNVIIEGSVTSVGDYMFYGCTNLKQIIIPNSVLRIGYASFAYCDSLEEIIIPNSVMELGPMAFFACVNLTDVVLSDNITFIEWETFCECAKLKNIQLPSKLEKIERYAFSYSGLFCISLPNTVSEIESDAFLACPLLEELIIPEKVNVFDTSNAYLCTNLNKLVFLNSECKIVAREPLLQIPEQVILSSTVGSEVEKFAITNNYHFLPLDGENAGVVQNHKYPTKWNTVLPATCTERGLTMRVCRTCCEIESKVIAPFGHNMSDYVITILATCKESGLETSMCSRCDKVDTKVIAKEKHSYSTLVVEPTCSTKGYTTYTCECGDTYNGDYSNTISHNYISEVTTYPSHLTEGVETFTCICGDSYTETIEKIAGHSYETTTVVPTCTEKGYTTYTCKCNYCYVSDYTDVIPHIDNNTDYECDYGCGYKFEKPADPTPDEPTNQTFIQKIISWFKNLFDKLFGWLKR